MRPSARFIISLLEQHDVRIDPGYRASVQGLDWPAFADAVDALQQSALEAASSSRGLALVLEGHAESELSGAEIIKFVGRKAGQSGVRELLRRHAADEKRHSRIFHVLSRLVEPEIVGKGLYPSLKRDPFMDLFEGDLNSFYCDTHFAEIRNFFYLSFLRQNVSHADSGISRKIDSGLSRIISDEKKHIVGTGLLINDSYSSNAYMPVHLRCAFERYISFIGEAAHE